MNLKRPGVDALSLRPCGHRPWRTRLSFWKGLQEKAKWITQAQDRLSGRLASDRPRGEWLKEACHRVVPQTHSPILRHYRINYKSSRPIDLGLSHYFTLSRSLIARNILDNSAASRPARRISFTVTLEKWYFLCLSRCRAAWWDDQVTSTNGVVSCNSDSWKNPELIPLTKYARPRHITEYDRLRLQIRDPLPWGYSKQPWLASLTNYIRLTEQ